MSFKAKYAGNCACCLKRFQIGDMVLYMDEQIVIEGHILDSPADQVSQYEKVCTMCYLVQPNINFPKADQGQIVCRFCLEE